VRWKADISQIICRTEPKTKKWGKIKMKIDIFRNIGKQSRESVGSEEEKGYVEKDFWIRENLSLE